MQYRVSRFYSEEALLLKPASRFGPRGNPTKYIRDQQSGAIKRAYLDGTFLGEGKKPCARCGRFPTAEGHDACLGVLDGVLNACCGHGSEDSAYVELRGGVILRGKPAIEKMRQIMDSKKE